MDAARIHEFADRLSDRFNPILIKEARQALKSRQFVATFMLLLFFCWLTSTNLVVWAGPALEFGAPARTFLGWFLFILQFAVQVIVPFSAYRSMQAEREQDTYELLCISTLSPRQIVLGKLGSSIMQIFLYYSAIAPFVAFSALLQGFDLAVTLVLLGSHLLWSILLTMGCLMLSTLGNQKSMQSINMLSCLVLLIILLTSTVSATTMATHSGVPVQEPYFWSGLVIAIVAGLSFFWLGLEIAVSRLTFESGNRSSRVRIVCSVQLALLWFTMLILDFVGKWWTTHFDADVIGAMAFSCAHLTAVGFFICAEPDDLSRRVRRDLPRQTWLKVLVAPWLPGGSRGMAYITCHLLALAAMAALVAKVANVPSGQLNRLPGLVWAVACYVLIYNGTVAALARGGSRYSVKFRPSHARVCVGVLTAMTMLLSAAVFSFDRRYSSGIEYIASSIFNPFVTLAYLMSDADRDFQPVILTALTAFAAPFVVLNLRPMIRAITVLWDAPDERSTSAG